MIIENVSTLQIHKLTKEQYEIALENDQLNDNSIYLIPTENKDYALKSDLETKADLINGKVPLSQLPDDIGGSNGVTSWNDLTDKPFYEEGLQIVWDGISSECEPIDVRNTLGCMCYKVGEKVEKDDIIGCTITMSEDIDPIVVDSSMIIDFNDKTFAVMYNGNTPVLFVASERNTVDLSMFGLVGQTLEIPFEGLWFYLFDTGLFTKSILSPNYEIKQIDKKYIPDIYLKSAAAGTPNGVATLDSTGKVPVEQLPDNIGGGSSGPIEVSWEDIENKPFYETGWSIEWDGTPTDEFFDVTDTMGAILYKVGESKTKEELIGATCKYNTFEPVETIEYTIASSDIMDTDSENCFVIFHNGTAGIAASVLIDGSYNFMGINFTLTKGIWFVKPSSYTPIYLGNKETKQLDPKFIPNYFGEVGTKITWNGKPTDTSISPGYRVEWDGSALNYPYVEFDPPEEAEGLPEGTKIKMQKVDEKRPTLENHYFEYEYLYDGSSENTYLTSDNITSEYDDNGNLIATHDKNMMWVWNVEQPGTVNVMGVPATFSESGLYFIYVEGMFKGTALHDDLYGITWYRVADPLNTTLDGYKMKVSMDGQEIEFIFTEGNSDFNIPPLTLPSGSSFGDMYVINIINDNEYIDYDGISFTVEKAGLYLLDFLAMESDGEITFDYLISPDYDIVKIDKKFLPNGIGGGSVADCPAYSGGAIMSDDNLIVFNYYKLIASMTADYKFDTNEALYNIDSDHFTITFQSSDVTSDNNIIIKIATGYSGPTDSPDLSGFTSDISVELSSIKELKKNSWYTAYCVYNETQNKWIGYLISASADTSDLEGQISNLERQINSIQNGLYDKQDKSYLVTSVDRSSKDYQYPSAKLLYDTKTELENSINTTKTDLTDLENNKQDKSNLVTSINENSTNYQYPSAKLLYNTKTNLETLINTTKVGLENSINTTKTNLEASINTKQDISNLVTVVDSNSTNEQYPSAKLLYDIIGDCDAVLSEINALLGE